MRSSKLLDKLAGFHLHRVVLVLAAVAALSPVTRAQYLHPKITSKQTTIRNVVLMPAKVDVVRDSMKGPEGMAAESELLSARVTQLISDALGAKHIAVIT